MQLIANRNLLTIAIPTFNRNKILLRNLERIMPQMDNWVELLIVDNNSDVPVNETVRQLCDRYQGISVRVIRNSENIGGNANVLRCIEYCETDYIWIIGDDDFPAEDALKTIHAHIRSKDAIWVNYYSEDPRHQPQRNENIVVQDLANFFRRLTSINELVFISNNIYRTACLKQGLEFGNMYQAMMAPHVVAMIAGIERITPIGTYRVSTDQLFASISNNEDVASAWPLYKAFIGIMSLYQVPFSIDVTKHILRLVRGARLQWLSNRYMFSAFSSLSSKNGRLRSFLISANFCISLLIVDRLKFISSFPIYIVSIVFGEYILSIYRKYK